MAEQNAFARACIDLFTRLWAQLESTATESPAPWAPADTASERRVEILRLELVVLLDACRATRWRVLLDGEQRYALERCLSEVLDCLNSRFEEAPLQALARAQNCLLDAVLEQHREAEPDRTIDQTLRRARA
jgi:hypothetical protein